MPTKNTIRAGTFAIAAAALWLATAAIIFSTSFENDDDWQAAYLVFSIAVLAAGVLGLLAAIGVSKRLGGVGTVGMIGLMITGVGVMASIIAWAVPFWMGLQGVGLLVVGLAVLRSGGAPKWSTVFVSSGFLLGVITFVVARAAELGDIDEWGNYPDADWLGGSVGLAIVAIGMIGWGLWLRSEEPVDIDNDSAAITA